MSEGVSFFNKIRNFGKLQLPTNKSFNQSNLKSPGTFINSALPVWRDTADYYYLLNCYKQNFVVQSVINIKAEAFANIKLSIRNLSNNEEIPLNEFNKDKGKLRSLLQQPNPLQSFTEWLRQLKVNREVFGNSYSYASVPVGFEKSFTYEDINAINNLPSYCVSPVLTGNWLEATEKEEIISKYVLNTVYGFQKDLNTNKVFHTNNTNIKFDRKFSEGESHLFALRDPISNIDVAYRSRNVLGEERGALGIISPEAKDEAVGAVAFTDPELQQVQKDFKRKYGLKRDQWQHIISQIPLKYTKMAMSVKELMLFEEVSHSGIAVCNAFGVPHELVPNYIKTGTLGTDSNIQEKRLYDSTIIPEAEDFVNGLNNFFKIKDKGYEIIGSYDHVRVLQANKKEEAQVKKLKVEAADKAFRMGSVPYRYVMNCMEAEIDESIASKYIWDLNEKQLAAIGLNKSNTIREDEK